MKVIAMIPLISFEIVVNVRDLQSSISSKGLTVFKVYLTLLFLIPLRSELPKPLQ
jgi:hypothetical protein